MREWRTIAGFSRYEASDDGRIRRPRRIYRTPAGPVCRRKREDGYLCVCLTDDSGKQRKIGVHQAVALAFLGPRPDGQLVRHLDGYRYNNRAGNLCYGTAAENAADTLLHGRRPQGEGHYRASLTEVEVRAIHARCCAGEKQADVAAGHGVHQGTVAAIMCGKNWKSLGLQTFREAKAARRDNAGVFA